MPPHWNWTSRSSLLGKWEFLTLLAEQRKSHASFPETRFFPIIIHRATLSAGTVDSFAYEQRRKKIAMPRWQEMKKISGHVSFCFRERKKACRAFYRNLFYNLSRRVVKPELCERAGKSNARLGAVLNVSHMFYVAEDTSRCSTRKWPLSVALSITSGIASDLFPRYLFTLVSKGLRKPRIGNVEQKRKKKSIL